MTQQQRGYTAAQVETLLEKAKAEGKADISMSTFYRLAREGSIEKILPEDRVKEALYNPDQVHDLIEHGTPAKRRRRAKSKEEKQEQQQASKIIVSTSQQEDGATDWIKETDLPFVWALDIELYGIENSVSPTTTLTWWRKNPHACRILFNKNDRREVWGGLSVIPMEEDTIYRLLRGDLKEQDITADQVLEYQPGRKYSCYVASVAILPEHRKSFGMLLHSILSFWCEQYPDVQITSLYGFALNEELGTGLRLIRKLYFAPRYDLGENAWELRLDRYSPSPVIQRFQECLEQRLKRREQGDCLPTLDNNAIPEIIEAAASRSVAAGVEYQLATSEDISDLAPIDEAIFGPSGLPLDEYMAMHRMWWGKNHEIFHVLRWRGRVVGYVSTVPLPDEKIMRILREEERPRHITSEEIDLFEPGKPLNVYIAVLGIDNGFTKHMKSYLAGKLIHGLTETFREWGQRGVDIRAVYARSRFEEAISLLEQTGFQELKEISPVNQKLLFCLNLETSNEPFAVVYKEGAKEYHRQQPND